MKLTHNPRSGFILIVSLALAVSSILFAFDAARAQEIVSCAAPASALNSAYITVNADQPQVNVRSGPNSYLYGKVGFLFTYESAPALGRSPGGDWFQISCPGAPGGAGWVYAANVTLTGGGDLPVVAAPVTVTPVFTATVDPTLAAAFPTPVPTSTRLPTFTPAVPPASPVFTDPAPPSPEGSRQGSFILIAALLGLAGLLLSFFVKR